MRATTFIFEKNNVYGIFRNEELLSEIYNKPLNIGKFGYENRFIRVKFHVNTVVLRTLPCTT